GDGAAFLGAYYALACWVDELFIVYCPAWSTAWAGQVVEFELFGSRDRAWKFWEQLDIATRKPGSRTAGVSVGPDGLETFYLCIALGFRGDYKDRPETVREYIDALRPQFSKAAPWRGPRDLGVETNVEPLVGRETLLRGLWAYAGAAIGLLLLNLVLAVVVWNRGAW
ncbi:MAG: DotU family type IV/VI secretion system protein, partial [Thermoleophilia bacterium]|nr:DotU family type IV/VI secretion system protein [Thermoleophilia bacterium]